MGLNNMRERAESLPAGRFEFTGVDTGGCRVAIHFALTRVADT
jgi:signal transduction histidine kinase